MDVTRLALVLMAVGCSATQRSQTNNEENTFAVQMSLEQVPEGRPSVGGLNLAYNRLKELPAHVFVRNHYRRAHTIQLSHNRISQVHPAAFRGIFHLRTLDLSYNNLTSLDSHTFKHNHALRNLDLAYNNLVLDPERPLVRSPSLESLQLSRNRIIHVYDINFAFVPNLQVLHLDHNPLYYLSSKCFKRAEGLQFISLAETSVHTLTSSMFGTLPRLVDLTGTLLAQKFEPRLRKVRSRQLLQLMNLESQDFVTREEEEEEEDGREVV
ncbi:leucine-rich repeat transmembrane neuronal protein 3-like [Euwallacea fornicatus]|uniref:leucine-rich repeat transmembrane neuronal protein 3-like n=1 Tax=Euwallacea fornicatus TaxID=995702 RepID=UPI00338E6834